MHDVAGVSLSAADRSQQVLPSSEGMTTCTFGPFRLDSATGQLRRGDTVVPLAPKAFTVLQHLAMRGGQLVTKDDLLELAWADVHVGDGALKVCIREIRRALNDDSRTPTYIETAHRRGYRFIAPVTLDLHAAPPAGTAMMASGSAVSVVSVPETHYARNGDVNIAYQVVGSGPRDLVFVMGWVSHLDYFWAEPSFARFLHHLASFSRLILIDKRGTGLSDRVTELPTLEQRMDDVRAVMDQVGSSYAALMGVSEGGPMCALFAATYPEKTRALVMVGTYAKRLWDPEYPWGPTREAREEFYRQIQEGWGGPIGIEERAPSMAGDPAFRAWWATYLRMGASPGAALQLTKMNAEIDIRDILPSIRVPTLVLHRRHDRCLKVEEGRYVSSRIPGALFVELPGEDHLPFVGDQALMLDEIERFVTGASARGTARPRPRDDPPHPRRGKQHRLVLPARLARMRLVPRPRHGHVGDGADGGVRRPGARDSLRHVARRGGAALRRHRPRRPAHRRVRDRRRHRFRPSRRARGAHRRHRRRQRSPRLPHRLRHRRRRRPAGPGPRQRTRSPASASGACSRCSAQLS